MRPLRPDDQIVARRTYIEREFAPSGPRATTPRCSAARVLIGEWGGDRAARRTPPTLLP
jgi:hypothetical protein